jgi:phospholipid transport system substrate-binding protein
MPIICRFPVGPSATRRVCLAAAAVFALVFCIPTVGQAEDQTSPEAASAFIEDLGNRTLGLLAAEGRSLEQKEADVRALLADNFALVKIGRFVLGKAWKKASQAEKDEYLRLFSEYVLATYSRRLGGYSGESFSIAKAEPMGKRDAVVVTEISRPSGPPLVAGWRVRDVGEGRMQILDVIVEGTSMLVTQRNEFASVVRSKGVGGLIEMLRVQLTRFGASAA